ncbi:MAG: Sop2p [Paramarteilia canceri]
MNPKLLFDLKFDKPVRCHSFNKDCSKVAIYHETEEFSDDAFDINIYDCTNKAKPKLLAKLKNHTSHIRYLDWAPNSNFILSCSADQNCYVWKEESSNNWTHVIVQSGLKFSASICKWSPDEKSLAIGSCSGNLRVCYYNSTYNWWGAKNLKDQSSAILSLCWDKSSKWLAVGTAERLIRVYEVEPLSSKPFFTQVTPYKGFCTNVMFTPSGDRLVAYSQDSCFTVIDFNKSKEDPNVTISNVNAPTFSTMDFINDKTICCAGFDKMFYTFSIENDGKVKLNKSFGENTSKSTGPVSAMAKFKSIDFKGSDKATGAMASKTHHTKIISLLQKTKVNEFSASGFDNKISIWSF